jgi:8-amino-7-oxononanoate synthase
MSFGIPSKRTEANNFQMPDFNKLLQKKIQQRKADNSFRMLSAKENLIDFTSNDYLGLAKSEDLFELITKKVDALPHRNGASGSRLLSGNSTYTEEVEKKLAHIFKGEAALIFNSGYAANQAVLSCIPQRGDTILYDELAHACIRDGSKLSFANQHSFRHNQLDDLEKKLKQATGNTFVIAESIYSMDGDESPIEDIIKLSDHYGAFVMIDEAHSTGVIGPNGSGFSVTKNVHNSIGVRVYTFGKAMGCHGACVVGSKDLIDYLINFARPFIYTTALSTHSVAAIECSFQYLGENMNLQKLLSQKIELFTDLYKKHFNTGLISKTQIQGIIIPGNKKARDAAAHLQHRGFDVRAILSPTVPEGSERLRICLHTYNTEEEIENLVRELSALT